jgi:hypothetical protein
MPCRPAVFGLFAPVSALAATVQRVVVRGAQLIIRFDSPVKRAGLPLVQRKAIVPKPFLAIFRSTGPG